ncbi:unnamed protein product [Mesocestoides corti]|nr:unnamed protein product [Mesocestoides corti]
MTEETADKILSNSMAKRLGTTQKSVKIDESSLQQQAASCCASITDLEAQIVKWLRLERIDLSEPPYTNDAGGSGIPLRLIERYACEAEKDCTTIALTLERIREQILRKAQLPFASNLEEIHSRRYLNCNGIKTDNLGDFLTTIGLPMYAECLTTALRGNNAPIPANLSTLTDAEMIFSLGIPVEHVRRIRAEAALIPRNHLSCGSSGRRREAFLQKRTVYHKWHQQTVSWKLTKKVLEVTPCFDSTEVFDKV